MEEYMIVEEYLNHFYTYEELADYLNVDVERISYVLDNVQGKISETVKRHKGNIDKYDKNNGNSVSISSEVDARVVAVANYIIDNNASIRATAKHFNISKTTVNDNISEKLPQISIVLYKKVFDVLQSHKSLSPKYKSRMKEIEEEYKLLEEGLVIEEICETLNCSRNQVQRDLANRSKEITKKMNEKAKKLLHYNRMKMNRR